MDKLNLNGDWQQSNTDVFWAEIAPCDHVVQIYEKDEDFLDLLENFISGGIKANDSVIFIGTASHLKSLEKRLNAQGFDLNSLFAANQYIPLNAEEILSKFMVNGWPDEILFINVVKKLIERARGNNRKVRAFGEMVAILWARGHSGATVQLEHLWNKFCDSEELCLLCAYPKTGFTQSASDSMKNICCAHTKIIKGLKKSKKELYYKNTEYKKAV